MGEGNLSCLQEDKMSYEIGGRAHRDCPTYKILECIDPTEYANLVDAAKDGLKVILSCGTIDTRPGNIVRSNLELIFPIGKITRTNLDAMFAFIPPGHP